MITKEPSLAERKAMRKKAIKGLYAELAPQVRAGGPFELKVAIEHLIAAAAKLPKPY